MNRTLLGIKRIAAILLFIGGAQAQAASLSTSAESRDANSPLIIDTDTSNVPGTISSFIIDPDGAGPGFSGDASARAIQSSSGNAAVSVEGLFAGGGAPGPHLLSANAVFEETVTNTSSVAQQVTFNFNIAPITLQLFGRNNFGVTQTHTASYDILITQDGSSIFQSGADFIGLNRGGAKEGVLVEDSDTNPLATDLGGVVSNPPLTFPFPPSTATFGAFSDSIDLGTLGPGASTTVRYSMTASFLGPEFESGGAASIGDPLNFDQTPGVMASFDLTDTGQPEVVPIPSAAWMGLSLLGGIGLIRRCRSTA